ncbi:shikimate dehydrogenase [Pseudooceanicola onchidii]|uniref:shikimate dehydrogenase n=1 Tax=Pseudooceanicola onchidii TaxID=2562279 RepID=UPI00197D6DDC|nr:shikimate dehydrogenase [Pseudooceanicola onchidii]
MTALPRIPLAAVIGCPAAHSRSPHLFRHWLTQHDLPGHYVPAHVEPEDFETVLRTMARMGFVGANVTLPHKEQVLKIADVVTDTARRIGAANTVTFQDDGVIHADNTDAYGFISNLHQDAPDWQPASAPALVLGAGGAARAIIVALLDAGVPEIRLTNRTRTRAKDLATTFGPAVTVVDWADAAAQITDCLTVVNTTSLGMAGKDPLLLDLAALSPDHLVTDIVYTPLQTELLKTASQVGCTTVDGLGMLLHQAVPGFERWFGVRPEVTEETRKAVLA